MPTGKRILAVKTHDNEMIQEVEALIAAVKDYTTEREYQNVTACKTDQDRLEKRVLFTLEAAEDALKKAKRSWLHWCNEEPGKRVRAYLPGAVLHKCGGKTVEVIHTGREGIDGALAVFLPTAKDNESALLEWLNENADRIIISNKSGGAKGFDFKFNLRKSDAWPDPAGKPFRYSEIYSDITTCLAEGIAYDAKQKGACKYDTDGDGNCGKPTCKFCHPENFKNG